MSTLTGVVCLVTGATRGIGRSVALCLGECGATVYITGRTLKPTEGTDKGRSLEEIAEEINASGGKAIPVLVDHADEKQINDLFDRIRREQRGQLDVLVNNAFSAVHYLTQNFGKKFFQIDHKSPADVWDLVNNVGLRNVYICSATAANMMIDYERQREQPNLAPQGDSSEPKRIGLIINISSIGGKTYLFNTAYGTGKAAIDRMSSDMAEELKQANVNISIFSLWPGLVRTEAIQQAVLEKKAGELSVFHSIPSESTDLTGRAIAALVAEPASRSLARSGDVILVTDVTDEYGIRDVDGGQPVNIRSLKYCIMALGYRIGTFIPSFIRFPKSWYFSMIHRISLSR